MMSMMLQRSTTSLPSYQKFHGTASKTNSLAPIGRLTSQAVDGKRQVSIFLFGRSVALVVT